MATYTRLWSHIVEEADPGRREEMRRPIAWRFGRRIFRVHDATSGPYAPDMQPPPEDIQ